MFRMEAGRRFHDLAAAAGNERSPRGDRCVGGAISNRVSAERKYGVKVYPRPTGHVT